MDKTKSIPQQAQFWESFGKSRIEHESHSLGLPAQILQ